jgi:hypothetical protein
VVFAEQGAVSRSRLPAWVLFEQIPEQLRGKIIEQSTYG